MSGTDPGTLGQPDPGATAAPQPASSPAPGDGATDAGDPAAGAPAAAAEPKREPWEVRRVRQLTARNAAMEAELAALRDSQPKPAPGAPPTPATYQADVAKAAAELAKTTAFNDACNAVAKLGETEHPDFTAVIGTLWGAVGGFKPELVEAAMEAGDAHELLYRLGQDPEEAERIAALSPARMGAALAKIAAKPVAAAPAVPQSNAPPPIRPLARGGGEPDPRPDGTQEQFSAWYERQRKARGR